MQRHTRAPGANRLPAKPGRTFHGPNSSRGENRLEDVRAIFGFLAALAADYDCAVLLIHHLRKRHGLFAAEQLSQDDFHGSSHVTAAPRSVLGLSVMQTRPGFDRAAPRKLEVVKSNLGSYPDPLGITFESLGPDAARLHYGPAPQPYRPPSQLERCAAWLIEALRDTGRPMPAGEIVALANDAGFCRSLVFRARDLVGDQVLDTHARRSPHNQWYLAAPGLAPGDGAAPPGLSPDLLPPHGQYTLRQLGLARRKGRLIGGPTTETLCRRALCLAGGARKRPWPMECTVWSRSKPPQPTKSRSGCSVSRTHRPTKSVCFT